MKATVITTLRPTMRVVQFSTNTIAYTARINLMFGDDQFVK